MTSLSLMGTTPTDRTPTVVVGVGAGIAAYKVAIVVREFRRLGWVVHVIPTPNSLYFVGSETWRELSENPVATDVFNQAGIGHVQLARLADLIVLAPATADLLARASSGFADDLLSTTLLASSAPVLACPAMHTQMWLNSATKANIEILRNRGWTILEPESGELSSGDSGIGRLPDPHSIVAAARELLVDPLRAPLAGRRIMITAGGTREVIDPVRFIGNLSTGTQGVALARAALEAGAAVDLVVANVSAELPKPQPRLSVTSAPSTQEMLEAVQMRSVTADALIMAAAVSDFRPENPSSHKLKKQDDSQSLVLRLEQTPDILAKITSGSTRPQVVVGFGAETGDEQTVLALGAEKARRKRADLLAVNRVGEGIGFGEVENTLHYFDADGRQVGNTSGSKVDVARDLIARVAGMLAEGNKL